jgi:hypothetical protein
MSFNTVMEFTFIEFDENWDRSGTVQYTARDKAMLKVVAEDKTGNKTTYFFRVEKGAVVLVSYSVNLVYIPEKCIRREDGDKTKCYED